MKVAIPSQGSSWSSLLAESFAHAACFFLVDERRAHVQIVHHPSPYSKDAGQVLVPMLADAKVQLVIANRCDDQDTQRLADAGIRLMTGIQGSVDLVYRRFYHGLLGSPCEYLVE